ncbi:MAG TPA: hypothetical protein VFK65_10830 [Candidatus Binatia bacterium]|nr:hypothetical protein [Candidatus Binatia bacterium]
MILTVHDRLDSKIHRVRGVFDITLPTLAIRQRWSGIDIQNRYGIEIWHASSVDQGHRNCGPFTGTVVDDQSVNITWSADAIDQALARPEITLVAIRMLQRDSNGTGQPQHAYTHFPRHVFPVLL